MRNALAIWQGMYQESLRLNIKIEIRVYTYVCTGLQFLLLKIINVQFVHAFFGHYCVMKILHSTVMIS